MLKLIYNDVAVGAAEDATVTAGLVESFSDVAALPFGVEPPAIATLELNGWGLSHDYKVRSNQRLAFWSTQISGATGGFDETPVIDVTFSKKHTSTGITIRFSPETMEYCSQMSVWWYADGRAKTNKLYYPDSPEFLIENTVEGYDKVKFVFYRTSLPGKRVKVEKITFGITRNFDGRELTGGRVIQECSLISDVVPVNVLDADFHSLKRVDYVFQRKQPVEAYNGDSLLGVFYLETGVRTGANDYSISCSDAIGVLDLDEYSGGLWISDTPIETILSEVFAGAFEFDIDPAYSGATLRGYIEPGTKREALQSIAFALGAVVDTAGTNKIKLFPMPTGEGVSIPPQETYKGGKVDISDTVTEVTVTAYVIFDERPGEGDEYIEHNGVQYRYYTETKHAYNPDTIATDLPNKVKFIGSHLVNLSNAQTLADNIMNYYRRRETYSVEHILDGYTTGDRVGVYLPWGEAVNGHLTKMTVSCTGIVVSDSEIILD